MRLGFLHSYSTVVRGVALTLAAATVCLLALFAAGAPAVIESMQARADRREPIAAETTGLLRYAEFESRWRTVSFTRVLVAASDGEAPAPAGLDDLPAEGHVALSPGLRDLAAAEPTVASYFDAYERDSLIAASGLENPGELRAVIGVDVRTTR